MGSLCPSRTDPRGRPATCDSPRSPGYLRQAQAVPLALHRRDRLPSGGPRRGRHPFPAPRAGPGRAGPGAASSPSPVASGGRGPLRRGEAGRGGRRPRAGGAAAGMRAAGALSPRSAMPSMCAAEPGPGARSHAAMGQRGPGLPPPPPPLRRGTAGSRGPGGSAR